MNDFLYCTLTYLYVWPVTSLRTTTCSTIHLADAPALSCPMRSVVRIPRFLCWNDKHMKWVSHTIQMLAFDMLTWNTNSSELRGMKTCCVSCMLPEIATQTLADVVAGPHLFDGNITTRYGNSVIENIEKSITNSFRPCNIFRIMSNLKLTCCRIDIREAAIIYRIQR